jgi:hypothetical protein
MLSLHGRADEAESKLAVVNLLLVLARPFGLPAKPTSNEVDDGLKRIAEGAQPYHDCG